MFRYVLALAAILVAYLFLALWSPWPLDPRLALAFAVASVALLFILARRLLPAAGRGLAFALLVVFGVLPLGACSTTTAARVNAVATQVDAVGQNVAPALLIVIQQDADAGLVDKTAAAAASDYVSAVGVAVQAVKTGSAACAAGGDKATCALAALQASLEAGDQLLANPAINKLIGDAAGPRVAAALKAARTALLAAQDVKTAATATDQSQKQAAALAAVFQLNATLLQAVQAAR